MELLKGSKNVINFYRVPKGSKSLKKCPKISKKNPKNPKNLKDLKRVPNGSKKVPKTTWLFLKGSKKFQKVKIRSKK